MWVRLTVRCEAADSPASLIGQLHRFADQIGMTTAGLAEMGWKIAIDEVAKKAAEKAAAPAGQSGAAQPRRLRVAPDATA